MLSDVAWRNLRDMAVKYGYVKAASRQRSNGIVGFFYCLACPVQVWVDERPEWMVSLSQKLLDPTLDAHRRRHADRTPTYLFGPGLPTAHPDPQPESESRWPALPPRAGASPRAPGAKHPIWWDPELVAARRQHRVQGGPEGFPTQYYADLALTHGIGDPRHVHLPVDKPVLMASNALEAIGHGMLRPTLIFHNPSPPQYAYVRTSYPSRQEDIDW